MQQALDDAIESEEREKKAAEERISLQALLAAAKSEATAWKEGKATAAAMNSPTVAYAIGEEIHVSLLCLASSPFHHFSNNLQLIRCVVANCILYPLSATLTVLAAP